MGLIVSKKTLADAQMGSCWDLMSQSWDLVALSSDLEMQDCLEKGGKN